MSLPAPDLDDRRFQDIVDEAKRRINRLCPEWTDHNVSDPGVALIELFAWMTEMTIFRLNQVPDAFYTHMLNLIGFEPFPATAARALGLGDVPLICARELDIDGSLPRVVRVMAHVESPLARKDVSHVYLRGAEVLRRDLAQ